jgi:hypothetical protein
VRQNGLFKTRLRKDEQAIKPPRFPNGLSATRGDGIMRRPGRRVSGRSETPNDPNELECMSAACRCADRKDEAILPAARYKRLT